MPRSLAPQRVTDSDWYYEFPSHLLLVHEVRDKAGRYLQTDQVKIPWQAIKNSLARRHKPAKKRAAR